MVLGEHYIDIYKWNITIACVDDYDRDGEAVRDMLEKKCVLKELIDECVQSIDDCYYNGGYIISNKNYNESVFIFLKHDKYEDAICTLMHEKRHLEDDILDALRIDDSEAAAYLAGYLAVIFNDYSKYLLK